jgi:hypothetical protein
VLRQNGRAVPLEPHELKQEVGSALRRVREGHEGTPPQPAREKAVRNVDDVVERLAGPVAPERFAVLQSLLAFLLAACGEERTAEISASELLERFPSVPAEELEEHPPSSTLSTSAAGATRSTPSCGTTPCTSTRSSGATPSAPRPG